MGESFSANRCDAGSASQVGRCLKLPESSICLGENGVGSRQSFGFKTRNAGKAVKDRLDTLHHDRAPVLFSM
jgi:hydrogenase maturation factor HypE